MRAIRRIWPIVVPTVYFAAFALFVQCNINCAVAAGPAAGMDGFLQDYREALQKTVTYFADVKAAGELSDVMKKRAGSSVDRATVTFERGRGASKYERVSGGHSFVWCRNPAKYVFQLYGFPAGQEYEIGSIESKDSPISDSNERFAYQFLDASHAVLGTLVTDILADSTFKPESITWERAAGIARVHLSYKYLSSHPNMVVHGGELWLSPENGYGIVRSEFDFTTATSPTVVGHVVSHVEYSAVDQGVGIPGRVHTSISMGQIHRDQDFVFRSLEHISPDERDFTLTNYSLPEVDPSSAKFVQPGGAKRSYWLLAINVAIVLAFLAAVLTRRMLRRRPKPAV